MQEHSVYAELRWIVARDQSKNQNWKMIQRRGKCGEMQKPPSKQWPVFKHCSLLVNCNRNLKTRPKNHLHGTSYLRLSEATNKAVLLNSALSSSKACCFCFLCSNIFLKPSIGMFLVVLFPSRSLSISSAGILLLSFVRSKHSRGGQSLARLSLRKKGTLPTSRAFNVFHLLLSLQEEDIRRLCSQSLSDFN